MMFKEIIALIDVSVPRCGSLIYLFTVNTHNNQVLCVSAAKKYINEITAVYSQNRMIPINTQRAKFRVIKCVRKNK
jgi:hypothetical protein